MGMYDSTKFYTNKIFYQQNRTLLTYLYIFDDVFDNKECNLKRKISKINIYEKIYSNNMRTNHHKTL